MAAHTRPADPVAAAADGTRVLDASALELTDLSGLARLTALQRLDLSDNSLTELGALASLVALKDLDLSGNRVADPLAAGGAVTASSGWTCRATGSRTRRRWPDSET